MLSTTSTATQSPVYTPARMDQLNSQLQNASKLIQILQPQLQAQMARADKLSNDLNEAIKAKEWVIVEWSQFKDKAKERHQVLEEQIEQLRKEVIDSNSRLQGVERERDEFIDKGRELQARQQYLEQNIEAAKAERGQLLQEIHKTQTAFVEALGTVENLNGQISQLTIQLQAREAEQNRLKQVATQQRQAALTEKGKRWDLLLQERKDFYEIGNVSLFGQYLDSWVHFDPKGNLFWESILPDSWTGRAFPKEAEFLQLSRELGRAMPPKSS